MKINLTLAQKAIVLVCVPLVFEIAFVGILAQLLQQSEHERFMEAHAKDVQSQVNVLLGLIIDAGAGLVISEFAKSKKVRERYALTSDTAREEFGKLMKLVKGNPSEEKGINRIGNLNNEIRLVLKHARQDSEDDNKLGLVRDFSTLQSLMLEFTAATGEITAQQKEIERARSRARVRTRVVITQWLFGGLLFNIGLAVGLAMYFNRGTASRMIILMDNTRRLARGDKLNPPISGTDEIAHLDKTFNEMADALALAARKERAIISNARDVICSIDRHFNFSAVNPASLQVWGYTAEELVGKGLDLVVPSDEIEKLKTAFGKYEHGDSSLPIECRIVRKDESEIEMLLSVQWSKQEETYFCVAHDITERKQIEQMKREFVAMVSHDLRTPLTSIQGFLSLLDAGAYGELTDSGADSLAIADNSITRLIKLINDLLDAERLESGKLDLQLADVSVVDIFEQSADAVEAFAQQQGVRILIGDTHAPSDNTKSIAQAGPGVAAEPGSAAFQAASGNHESHADETPENEPAELIIRADGDRLIQVLVNLLSNAIKFSPKGSKVRLMSAADNDFIEFKVIDEGRGIPADFLDSVFERFKQVKKSDAKNKSGTGLGLAICKAIVEKHGGTIGVTSEEGKGSTFWFKIPKEISE